MVMSPEWFSAQQIPSTPMSDMTSNSRVVAMQLCNLYALLAFIGIGVLSTTKEYNVIRGYLIALAIGDVGHLYVTSAVLGLERFIDVRQWNAMAWGNIGVTVSLKTIALFMFAI